MQLYLDASFDLNNITLSCILVLNWRKVHFNKITKKVVIYLASDVCLL